MDPNFPNYNNPVPPNNKGKSASSSSRGKKEPMKVKYISSPILVQASNESEFRAVVQELTGKDSPGTHPGSTAPATSTTTSRPPDHGGQQGGYYSSGFDQNMTWKDY